MEQLKPLTKQEIFDKALNGIRGQNYERSYDKSHGGCVYSGPNGIHCAVGHCLTEKQRQRVLDNKKNDCAAFTLCDSYSDIADYLDYFSKGMSSFIDRLQNIHDRIGTEYGRDEFEEKMKNLAKSHSLTYTPPDVTVASLPCTAPTLL